MWCQGSPIGGAINKEWIEHSESGSLAVSDVLGPSGGFKGKELERCGFFSSAIYVQLRSSV
jgi:hypothetical protein